MSHDETFKSLFCLIGQEKMSQKIGEVHSLHTFRGFTGCTIGVSAQRSTSHECFTKAVKSVFDDELASRVKFIYSDCPERIFQPAQELFKSLVAIGEDPLHLSFRVEYC